MAKLPLKKPEVVQRRSLQLCRPGCALPRDPSGEHSGKVAPQVRTFGVDTGRDLAWNTSGVNRHGFPWPPDCSEESLDFAEAWQPGPQDVFVSTYPKSGTTWMLHMVHQLASKGEFNYTYFHEVNPFWEATPDIHISLDAAAPPRVIKTHAPLSLIPAFVQGKCRAIYVVRDPRDTLVSFYNHSLLTQHLSWDGSFQTFYENFMAGKLYYGSWFDHAVDALQHKGSPQLLFLSYEEMQKDLPGVLQQIIAFMGYDVSAEVVENVIKPRLGFKFMKEHDKKFDFTLHYPTRKEGGSFFRRGVSGDGEAFLEDAHREAIRDKYNAMIGDKLPYQM